MEKERIVEMEKEIFRGEYCEECRKNRRECQFPPDDGCNRKTVKGHDQKYHERPSDMHVVIYSKDCRPPIDVLLVTFGHGGGPWPERRLGFEEVKDEIKRHYHCKEKYIETFHQFAMREVLQRLDENNTIWYLTDLIKCYVHTYNRKRDRRGNRNKDKAIEYCKDYFAKQVKLLKPKVIVLFGGDVQKGIFGNVLSKSLSQVMNRILKNKSIDDLREEFEKREGSPQASEKIRFGAQHFCHGKVVEQKIFGHKTKIMFSVFPSGNAADIWVAANFKHDSSSQHILVKRIIEEVKN